MTLYACGGREGGGGRGEGREKVGRGEQGGESTEAKGRRESKKEKRKKKGERTVRLLRTEMPLALCTTGRTLPSRCPEGPGEVLLPRAPPPGPQGCLSAGCRSPHKFLVATRGSAPGLRRPFSAPADNLPLCL